MILDRISNIFKAGHKSLEKLFSREENIRLYKDSRLARSVDCPNLPLNLLVEVTSRCNLSCVMCNVHHNTRSGINISEELLKATFTLSTSANVVHSYGLGEPLLHPDIVEIVKSYKLKGAFVSIITNGMLLSENISNGLVENNLDQLVISIDSADDVLFRKIRRGADLNTVKENIKRINEVKRLKDRLNPAIHMNVVVQRSNFYELIDLVRLARELDIYFITFSPITTHEHISEIKDEGLSSRIKDWKSLIEKCAKVSESYGVSINIERLYHVLNESDPEVVYKEKVPCPEPFNFMGIRANGDIYPCCNWDINDPLASLAQVSYSVDEILNIWRGKRWRDLRKSIIEDRYPEICKKCMQNFTRPFYDVVMG